MFIVVAAAVISRRPDALLNPQFYAEDGSVWYSQAYNLGWLHSLLIREGGYLNTLPRLVAGIALLVPLQFAPLVMNVAGILLQVLPVNVLLSARCSAWWPLPIRILVAAVYVALPNSQEVDVVITNAQWHLALLSAILAFSNPPRHWLAKVLDCVVFAISGLTGPFCFVLFPLVLIFWSRRRYRWSLAVAVLLAFAASIQLAELIYAGPQARAVGQLGAGPLLFLRILTGHVYLGALLGKNAFAVRASAFGVAIVMMAGTALLAYSLLKSNLELKLFIVFCMVLFAASLKAPLITGPRPQWQLLAIDRGARYWFFPMLGFLWSLIYDATQRQSRFFKIAGMIAMIVMLRGVVRDWRYPAFKDEHFSSYVQQFNTAPAGASVTIPICPEGHTLRLIKK